MYVPTYIPVLRTYLSLFVRIDSVTCFIPVSSKGLGFDFFDLANTSTLTIVHFDEIH